MPVPLARHQEAELLADVQLASGTTWVNRLFRQFRPERVKRSKEGGKEKLCCVEGLKFTPRELPEEDCNK